VAFSGFASEFVSRFAYPSATAVKHLTIVAYDICLVSEWAGFEPAVPFGQPDCKSGVIKHSTTPP
jgi:hypothetical protein